MQVKELKSPGSPPKKPQKPDLEKYIVDRKTISIFRDDSPHYGSLTLDEKLLELFKHVPPDIDINDIRLSLNVRHSGRTIYNTIEIYSKTKRLNEKYDTVMNKYKKDLEKYQKDIDIYKRKLTAYNVQQEEIKKASSTKRWAKKRAAMMRKIKQIEGI